MVAVSVRSRPSRAAWRNAASALLIAALLLPLAGCAAKAAQPPQNDPGYAQSGGDPQQTAPVTTGDSQTAGGDFARPSSLEDAAIQLDGAERDLLALLAAPPAPAPDPLPDAQPTGPTHMPSTRPHSQQGDRLSTEGQRCTLACRALGSMDRSAVRICELAGSDHDRCASAKDRVDKARRRVEGACPACGA